MGDDYTTRVGARWRKRPTRDYGQLLEQPTCDREDDGKVIVWVGDLMPVCADCERGHLRWAEAGYVPWHRICDVCGSHWDLHPLTWGPAKPSQPPRAQRRAVHEDDCDVYWEDEWSDEHGPRPCSCGRQAEIDAESAAWSELLARSQGLVRWVDGRGEVPIDPAEPLSGYQGLARLWPEKHEPTDEPTWGDLLALIRPEHWAAAEDPERVRQMAGMVVIPCAWARRARFYSRL